ncbi:MAG: hemerythrin domain-containing protein [Burkholderiales bacterium]|nr:MAG: hemerythrin domain-containing protein [Burkholderiales bacterium]
MSPGPMQGLRFAHNAILKTTAEIEQAVLGAVTPEVALTLQPTVDFLAGFIAVHVAGEEKALYPPLGERVPHIGDTFLHEHREEENLYAELRGLIGRVAETGAERDLQSLRRDVIALRALSDSHVHKENEIVLGLIFEHFDAEAQGAMLGGILSVIPPADMPRYVPWIVRCQEDAQAVAYVSILAKSAPAPVFAAARGWIKGGVDAARWALLVEKIPALAE